MPEPPISKRLIFERARVSGVPGDRQFASGGRRIERRNLPEGQSAENPNGTLDVLKSSGMISRPIGGAERAAHFGR